MTDDLDGKIFYRVTEPKLSDGHVSVEELAELDGLEPPPKSQRDVCKRLGWGGARAMAALQQWREMRGEV